jgi:SAM-dependent methyltransferase
MLDIGPGQQLRHMRCFERGNEVVGIDMDVIVQDFGFGAWLEMLRRNSLARVAKTMVRKAIGADRKFESALAARLGVAGFRKQDVRRMDAVEMGFAGASFDFVYSNAVFQHLASPEAALSEVRRVLAPGGIAYISLHLYTSHSGQHDPKMLVQRQPLPPFWPHLRREHRDTVSPSAFLNKLTFLDWKRLFDKVMPGAVFAHERHDELALSLSELRAKGELREYSDDDLLTLNFVALWQKPFHAQAGVKAPAGVRHREARDRAYL